MFKRFREYLKDKTFKKTQRKVLKYAIEHGSKVYKRMIEWDKLKGRMKLEPKDVNIPSGTIDLITESILRHNLSIIAEDKSSSYKSIDKIIIHNTGKTEIITK